MTRKPTTIEFWRGALPHWEVVDGIYFVTIHVAGAIPQSAAARIRQRSGEIANLPEEQQLIVRREIFVEMENWLDQVGENPHFSSPGNALMVCEAIEKRHTQGDWRMIEFVVMPNHVHLFFQTNRRLKKLIGGFKRWVAHNVSKATGVERVWQREWFDHWSRSAEQDEKFVRYIRRNPIVAGLVKRPEDWPYGSAGRPLPR